MVLGFFSLFVIGPKRVSNICKKLIWEMKKLRHLKKFVITNIEKPNLITDLIFLIIYPKQTLSLGQQLCAPGGPAGALPEGPAGACTWRASRCAQLEVQQVCAPAGPLRVVI